MTKTIRWSGQRVRSLTWFVLFAAIALLFCANRSVAQGDLLISPLRVIFEGSKKSQEISLANVGKDTATFAVSLKQIRMKEDGSFEEITEPDPGQRFADTFLRIFPRKVTLAPNESQVVKMQLIKTSQMIPGEYRSHLYFRAVPDEKPLGERNSKKDSAGISIQLKPIFGITIPVIIRMGENNADVKLSDPGFAMVDDKPVFNVTLNRTGDMSVYGDLYIDYISPGGKAIQVKMVKGIGVYTPNTIRRFKVELDTDKNIGFNKGKLHATYKVQMSDKTEKNVETEVELTK